MVNKTELADRMQISEMAATGQNDQAIAKEVGFSQWTVRKWRRRYQQQGRVGLKTKMGRPKTGAMSTYPGQMREALISWRRGHPGWGAKTLRTELKLDERFKTRNCPASAASIGCWKNTTCCGPNSPMSAYHKPTGMNHKPPMKNGKLMREVTNISQMLGWLS